jgi:hypothetical protein
MEEAHSKGGMGVKSCLKGNNYPIGYDLGECLEGTSCLSEATKDFCLASGAGVGEANLLVELGEVKELGRDSERQFKHDCSVLNLGDGGSQGDSCLVVLGGDSQTHSCEHNHFMGERVIHVVTERNSIVFGEEGNEGFHPSMTIIKGNDKWIPRTNCEEPIRLDKIDYVVVLSSKGGKHGNPDRDFPEAYFQKMRYDRILFLDEGNNTVGGEGNYGGLCMEGKGDGLVVATALKGFDRMDLGTCNYETDRYDNVFNTVEHSGIGGSIGALGGDLIVGDSQLLFYDKISNMDECIKPIVTVENTSGLGLKGKPTMIVGNSCIIGMEGKGNYSSSKTILEGISSQVLGTSEGLQSTSGLSVVDESLCNFLPTYREVLTRMQLPIYVGGVLLDNQKVGKAEGRRGQGSCGRELWDCLD